MSASLDRDTKKRNLVSVEHYMVQLEQFSAQNRLQPTVFIKKVIIKRIRAEEFDFNYWLKCVVKFEKKIFQMDIVLVLFTTTELPICLNWLLTYSTFRSWCDDSPILRKKPGHDRKHLCSDLRREPEYLYGVWKNEVCSLGSRVNYSHCHLWYSRNKIRLKIFISQLHKGLPSKTYKYFLCIE